MIASIRGTVIDLGDGYAVLEAHGVGYKIGMTDRDVARLVPGAEYRLQTHLAVREDSQDLYGFIDSSDLVVFKHLITISGIGPKSAMGILMVTTADAIASAVAAEKPEYLTKTSGIGKKTAEKIVRELAGKLEAPSGTSSQQLEVDSEVRMALVALGYSDREALEALELVPMDIVETRARLRAALQQVGRK